MKKNPKRSFSVDISVGSIFFVPFFPLFNHSPLFIESKKKKEKWSCHLFVSPEMKKNVSLKAFKASTRKKMMED